MSIHVPNMNMDSWRPLHDLVLIKRYAPETQTEAGIVVPASAQEKRAIGIVIAVGPGKILDSGVRVEPSVKKGDVVAFGKYAGSEPGDRDEYVLIRESELLAVVPG